MKNAKQEIIMIGDVQVPVIIEKGMKWYPMSYIGEKVLLRKGGLIGKSVKEKYGEYIKKCKVDFSFNNAGIQETNCMAEIGLKEFLINSKVGRLDELQRKAQNNLLKHLMMDLITDRLKLLNKITIKELNEHDEYVKNIIIFLMRYNVYKYQLCCKCDRYYPLDSTFFPPNNKNKNTGFGTMCHRCLDNGKGFKFPSKDFEKIYKEFGMDILFEIKENKMISIYKKYLLRELKHLPDCYHNRDDYIKIIKWLLDTQKITKDEIHIKFLMENFRLIRLRNLFNDVNQIYETIYGDHCKYNPFLYKNYKSKNKFTSIDDAVIIIGNYIKFNKVHIEYPLEFDYQNIANEAKIKLKCYLELAVRINNFIYPGYKFNIYASEYYKKETNLLFDLRYLIEQDMKIEIVKIPLYLTKTALHQKAMKVYNQIITKKNEDLYYWVNKLYPNKFIKLDFDVNYHRDIFDSEREAQIHDIIKTYTSNFFYNQRNTDRTVSIKGMIPDWVLFTDHSCVLIEYFGLYFPEDTSRSIIDNYVTKAEEKIRKYKGLNMYSYIFLYPEDIENNFDGVKRKIEKVLNA